MSPSDLSRGAILLRGGREHNLADIDLDLPHGLWTAVTGVSGSGKTSLVFDTLVREGRRRFLSSWSPKARQVLGKLGEAELDRLEGLPVPLAVGADRISRSERSTFGTLTGLSDLLRLVYARDGSGGPHRRSAFSFNSTGACEACGGLGQNEVISRDKLVVHPERSIRDGALGPTLPSGYTVYSQVTVEVMDSLCRAHGFTVDTPWKALTEAQRTMIFEGTTRIKVPFGKHSLESRLKWEGITARPREEGHYRGLVPVMTETLRRSRNPNILRYAISETCGACGGSRLGPIGRTTRIDGASLPELSAEPLRVLRPRLGELSSPVLDTLRADLDDRLARALEIGLGHLSLDRRSTTLSDGELQRGRLLNQLGLDLGGMLLAFDEPTLGLHPSAHPGLNRAFQRLLSLGNTLVTVEHHPDFVQAADRWVDLGPGAGPDGGRLMHDGPMPPAPLPDALPERAGRSGAPIRLVGARLHGLNTDLELQRGVLNVISGPSGAGKTSLVFGTLLPALRGEQGAYEALDGADGLGVLALDAKPLGRTPRSTPATYTGLFDLVRKRFAACGLTPSHFSHNHKKGRCETCEGLGVERVGLHLMRDVERPCPACGGGRYRPSVLEVSWRGYTVASLLQASVSEALERLSDEPGIGPMLAALDALGLGYLQLGRSTTTLSRGEAQRIRLARLLGGSAKPSMVLLDEPDRGLHPSDLSRLLHGLSALVERGHTLVAISHHPTLWTAADRLIEVRDGRARVRTAPPAAPVLSAPRTPPPDRIQLRGVRTHNLRDVDVDIPHRALTVICGRSGSGKSSLAVHTLAAEAQRRFAETLPFHVRRFLRRTRRPVLREATGLTPTVVLEQGRARGASVATASGIGELLRLLYARHAGLPASDFSTRRAGCATCGGEGTLRRCDPTQLIGDPSRSLEDGALTTKPGRFFTEPHGRHLAMLRAAGVRTDLPWRALEAAERELALRGSPHRVQGIWTFSRGKRSGEHGFDEPWVGFIALVEAEATKRKGRKDAEAWFEPFRAEPCEVCSGSGLRAPAREVRRDGRSFAETLARPIATLDFEEDARTAPVVRRLRERIADLKALSLGHLPLGAAIEDLSDGETQRLRLAEALGGGLVGLTLVLDEPDAGLDAAGVYTLLQLVRTSVERGNTAILVSHDRQVIEAADHLIELDQGQVHASGALDPQGPTARGFHSPIQRVQASPPSRRLCGHDLPEVGIVAITGPSGSGKSRRLQAFAEATDQPVFRVQAIRARTVGAACGRLGLLATRFHREHPEIPARAFKLGSPAGRCPRCAGAGVERVKLDILADLALPCEACAGRRFKPEILAATVGGRSIDQALADPLDDERARQLGLAHLSLGTPVSQLSGGELQRLAVLALPRGHGRMILLEAPDRGLHDLDLPGLMQALTAISERDLIVLTTRRERLLAAWRG